MNIANVNGRMCSSSIYVIKDASSLNYCIFIDNCNCDIQEDMCCTFFEAHWTDISYPGIIVQERNL